MVDYVTSVVSEGSHSSASFIDNTWQKLWNA